MRDSKPQHCVQQYKSLKVARNATHRNKHIKEASKQIFANSPFEISCKYTQGMLSNWKMCVNVLNVRKNDKMICVLNKIRKTI